MNYKLLLRHYQLVMFLSQYDAYRDKDGQPVFTIRENSVSGGALAGISFAQVNRAAEVLCDLFNLSAGDVDGGFDLYRLLQGYLLDEGKREEINRVIGV
ncbi:MAG TPA: hypothetical protein VMH27_11650 [Puia sp.]|nr:hypothetical protein [Puia sp.]